MTASTHNQPDQTNNGARDLFLSYNSRDREVVMCVRELLHQRAIKTFFDRNDLTPGMPWQSELERAISQVRAVAVLIGGEGIGAWQRPEKELALDRQVQEERAGRRFPVIPVLLPNAEADKVTGFLTRNTWIDLRGGLDNPMAAAALDALARAVTGEPPVPSAPAPEPLCPYRGLEPFHEDDAPLFFGRDKFADDLLQKVLAHPLVAVVGPSGSGKSSVVQAGLLPRLRREGWPNKTWEAVIFTPREHPFHSLAKELLPLYVTDKSKTEQMIEARTLGDALAEEKIPLDDPIAAARKAVQTVSAANEEGTDTRQRVRLKDLDVAAHPAVKLFVKERLLVMSRNEETNEEIMEVAHETLIKHWGRLKNFLNKDREFLLWRQRLNFFLSEWERLGQDEEALLQGHQLTEARHWVQERKGDLTTQELEFVLLTESDEYQIQTILSKASSLISLSEVEDISEWIDALVLSGRVNEALEVISKLRSERAQSETFATAINALIEIGWTEKLDTTLSQWRLPLLIDSRIRRLDLGFLPPRRRL